MRGNAQRHVVLIGAWILMLVVAGTYTAVGQPKPSGPVLWATGTSAHVQAAITRFGFRSATVHVEAIRAGVEMLVGGGTALAPSRSYIDDTDFNLGSYRIGENNEGFTAGGVLRWDYNTTRILSTIQIQVPQGTIAAPAIVDALNLGMGISFVNGFMRLISSSVQFTSDANNFDVFSITIPSSTTDDPFVNFNQSASLTLTTSQRAWFFSSTFAPASGTGTSIGFSIQPTINWGGTPGAGSYEGLRISVTETSLPTGSNYLFRMLAGAAGTTFRGGIRNTGQWESGGTAPTVSACGTTPAIVGTNDGGKVTVGTGVTTSCTVTFANTWANAPPCTVSGSVSSTIYNATSTTTVLTIISSADMASNVVSYGCRGYNS